MSKPDIWFRHNDFYCHVFFKLILKYINIQIITQFHLSSKSHVCRSSTSEASSRAAVTSRSTFSNQIKSYLYIPKSHITVCLRGLYNLHRGDNPLSLHPQFARGITCHKTLLTEEGLSVLEESAIDVVCTEQIDKIP